MRLIIVSIALAVAVACSSSGDKKTPDAFVPAVDAFQSTCGHPGDTGNEMMIGKFCESFSDCPRARRCARSSATRRRTSARGRWLRLERDVRHEHDLHLQLQQPVRLYSQRVPVRMTMKKLAGLLVLFVACGTDVEPLSNLLPTLHPNPAPANRFQLVTARRRRHPAGCRPRDVHVDRQDHDRHASTSAGRGYQSAPAGHHIVVYYTMIHQPPGTQRVCNDSDMATFRLVSGNGGVRNTAPGNLVYRIPAGAQIVLNHHWLNVTDQVVKGQAVINVSPADPGWQLHPVGQHGDPQHRARHPAGHADDGHPLRVRAPDEDVGSSFRTSTSGART